MKTRSNRKGKIGLILLGIIVVIAIAIAVTEFNFGNTLKNSYQTSQTTTIFPTGNNESLYIVSQGNFYNVIGTGFAPNTKINAYQIFLIPGQFVPAGSQPSQYCNAIPIITNSTGGAILFSFSKSNSGVYSFNNQTPPATGNTYYQFLATYPVINPSTGAIISKGTTGVYGNVALIQSTLIQGGLCPNGQFN